MYDPWKSKNRWIRIGNCLCEETAELRQLLFRSRHPILAFLYRQLRLVWRFVRAMLRHF